MADPALPSLPMMDPDLVKSILAAPPFVTVDGIFNFRDFGAGYPTSVPGARVKPLRLFRSGEPSRISPKGIEQLRALGIKAVFDLRADREITKYGTTTPAIEGVEFVRAQILEETLDPVGVATKLKEFSDNEIEAFVKLYIHILKTGSAALEQILVRLRDHANEPCLIHCTGGKDRSGVFAAVVLKILGVCDEDIVADYALTTVGLQPVLPLLGARFSAEPAFKNNWQGTLNMCTARAETMRAVMDAVNNEFGGSEAYVKRYTSLSDADLAQIRENLVETTL